MSNTPVIEFIGVYDADSTLLGEASYWINARLGRAHCSLCDITHGLFTKKREWREYSLTIGVPFSTYHRNDAPSDVLAAAGGHFPIVLARQDSDLVVVLTDADLAACGGSPAELTKRLTSLL